MSTSEPAADHTDPAAAVTPTEPARPGPADVAWTGEPEVDRALESLSGLESLPLADHHDRLARVHEELHRALNPTQDQP